MENFCIIEEKKSFLGLTRVGSGIGSNSIEPKFLKLRRAFLLAQSRLKEGPKQAQTCFSPNF